MRWIICGIIGAGVLGGAAMAVAWHWRDDFWRWAEDQFEQGDGQ